jgi:hypothetical protein
MKIQKLALIAFALSMFGCGKTIVPVEVKDVCAQPEGARIMTQGYISLPQTIDTIQLTKGGSIVAVGLQLFLMTKPDASGEAVRATFWTSDKNEPNKIKPLPRAYTWNDLLVYTDDGKTLGAGKIVKITGEIKPDDKYKCAVSVTKIENP